MSKPIYLIERVVKMSCRLSCSASDVSPCPGATCTADGKLVVTAEWLMQSLHLKSAFVTGFELTAFTLTPRAALHLVAGSLFDTNIERTKSDRWKTNYVYVAHSGL